MSFETPVFTTEPTAENTILRVKHPAIAPGVLFGAFEVATLRTYNYGPKNENIYLRNLDDADDARVAVSELNSLDVAARLQRLTHDFNAHFEKYVELEMIDDLLEIGRERVQNPRL